VIAQIEKRPELLRRENFVCYDGLPFNPQSNPMEPDHIAWLPNSGLDAWGIAQLLQSVFDALAGFPAKRRVTLLSSDACDGNSLDYACKLAIVLEVSLPASRHYRCIDASPRGSRMNVVCCCVFVPPNLREN
jgi:hypothetical protein